MKAVSMPIPKKYRGKEREAFLKELDAENLMIGLGADDRLEILLEANSDHCVPPLADPKVHSVHSPDISVDAKESEPDQSRVLVELATANEAELFKSNAGIPFVTFIEDGVRRTFALGDKAYRQWLTNAFYRRKKKAPYGGAIREAIDVLSGRAIYEGREERVFTRVGGTKAAVYIDLGDDLHTVVKVTGRGWSVVRSHAMRFRRPRGMRALPLPERGGSLRDLRPLLNLKNQDDFILVASWLVGSLMAEGPYPVLILMGEQGAAKTTTARLLRSLTDPNATLTRSHPHEERDLMVAAHNCWVIVFDNLSRIPPWLSDSLCRLATGGGFAKRENYSDMDEVLIEAKRPIILNGIETLATRGDLVDRSIVLELPRIKASDRRSEQELNADVENSLPKLFGALLDAVSRALRDRDRTDLVELPRMADFARTAYAAASSLGWTGDEFLAAYNRNRAGLSDTVIEASPIGTYVVSIAHKGFSGTATELLQMLEKLATDNEARHFGWPKGAHSLTNLLRRLAPALGSLGIHYSQSREGKAGTRMTHLRMADRDD